jgi:four helix bundle protein
MSEELETRFLNFALLVRDFCGKVKWDLINTDYIRQLLKASRSVSANYIEASDDLGKADEKMKIKIARREAKESAIFLKLISLNDDKQLENERIFLLDEAGQIRKILSSINLKLS